MPLRTGGDALALVPGLVLVQHGTEGKGLQLLLRGFDAMHGSDFEVLASGVPLNEWSNVHAQGYLDLSLVVPETIRRIEVRKGPWSGDQGAFAMAGSARYELGIAEEQRGARASYTVGSTNRQRFAFTYAPEAGDGTNFIATEALHDDGFGVNRGTVRSSTTGQFHFENVLGGRLTLLGMSSVSRFELPGALQLDDVRTGQVDLYDTYDRGQWGIGARLVLSAKHELDLGSHHIEVTGWSQVRSLELVENFTGFWIDPEQGDRRSQQQRGFSFGTSVEGQTALAAALLLRWGLSHRGDSLAQERGAVADDGARYNVTSLDIEQHLLGARVGFELRPTPELSLQGAGRLDVASLRVRERQNERVNGGVLGAFSPRALLQWKPWSKLQFTVAYGRGFRPPEARAYLGPTTGPVGISEELYTGGEPRMTVTDSGEVGLLTQLSRGLQLRLSGFGTWIERESIYDHVSGFNLELNATRRWGGELEVSYRPLRWVSFDLGSTLVDARFVESGSPLPFAPWLVGSARATFEHPSGWRGGLWLVAWAPRPLPHGAVGASMVRLDLSVGYKWLRYSLDLMGQNVLGLPISEGEYHYASQFEPGQVVRSLPELHVAAGPPLNLWLRGSLSY